MKEKNILQLKIGFSNLKLLKVENHYENQRI